MLHSIVACIDRCHISGCCINSLMMTDIPCYQCLCTCVDNFFDNASACTWTKATFSISMSISSSPYTSTKGRSSLFNFFARAFYSQLSCQISCFQFHMPQDFHLFPYLPYTLTALYPLKKAVQLPGLPYNRGCIKIDVHGIIGNICLDRFTRRLVMKFWSFTF